MQQVAREPTAFRGPFEDWLEVPARSEASGRVHWHAGWFDDGGYPLAHAAVAVLAVAVRGGLEREFDHDQTPSVPAAARG